MYAKQQIVQIMDNFPKDLTNFCAIVLKKTINNLGIPCTKRSKGHSHFHRAACKKYKSLDSISGMEKTRSQKSSLPHYSRRFQLQGILNAERLQLTAVLLLFFYTHCCCLQLYLIFIFFVLTHCLPPPSFWADNFSLSACKKKIKRAWH